MTRCPVVILCDVETCAKGVEADLSELEDAVLQAHVTSERGSYSIDCPSLAIHVSDQNCSRAQRKFEDAIVDYYKVLHELPSQFMGEVQRQHLEFYESELLPAMAKFLAEQGRLLEKQHSIFDHISQFFSSTLGHESWSPQVSKLAKC